MPTPNAAQTAHAARQAADMIAVITETCHSMSPPTVVKAASAPMTLTHALGLTQMNSVASTKPIGRARLTPALAAAALPMRQAR